MTDLQCHPMIEPCGGWGLAIMYRRKDGGFLGHGVFSTRKEVIDHYNNMFARPDDQYRKARRRGEVMAVKVRMEVIK